MNKDFDTLGISECEGFGLQGDSSFNSYYTVYPIFIGKTFSCNRTKNSIQMNT